MSGVTDEHVVRVCDRCLLASCWQGTNTCDAAAHASGAKLLTVAELRALDRENPAHYLPHAFVLKRGSGVLRALREEGCRD